jgi:hypothetical protein
MKRSLSSTAGPQGPAGLQLDFVTTKNTSVKLSLSPFFFTCGVSSPRAEETRAKTFRIFPGNREVDFQGNSNGLWIAAAKVAAARKIYILVYIDIYIMAD